MSTNGELCRLFGELLEYPLPDLPERARRCRDLLAGSQPEAAGLMSEFVAFAESTPTGRLEEIYSATFDLSPECSPYLGHQLFGEDPKRPKLMVGLQESYRSAGFAAGNELPDHVAVLLRFLAGPCDAELSRDLAERVVAPGLDKMAQSISEKNVYRNVIRAAAAVVGRGEPACSPRADTSSPRADT